jgi:dihydroorotase
MIRFHRVRTLDNQPIDLFAESPHSYDIDGSGLTALPAVIDPHVHFRTPGNELKEDWTSASQAAIAGGVTTVFDMPNNHPTCVTQERIKEKRVLIDQQLAQAAIPLRYKLYLGASRDHLDQLERFDESIIAIKLFMGSSTGDLLVEDRPTQSQVFKRAAENDLMVAVHAEDERLLRERQKSYASHQDPAIHSQIRSPDIAAKAVDQAIRLAAEFGTRLYILHTSTEKEWNLIRRAKDRGLPVFAEATPHHLFLDTSAYEQLGTFALVNPPLRLPSDKKEIWKAIEDGTIDTIGSDHAPHLIEEKRLPYGQAPSGVPGVETLLPLLLTAVYEGLLSTKKFAQLTRKNAETIFKIPPNSDWVLVDMSNPLPVVRHRLKTRCGWSPFEGKTLRGWPVYTLVQGELFKIEEGRISHV